jgi:hypothetical protein
MKEIFILMTATCKINFTFLQFKFIQAVNDYEFRILIIVNENYVIV